MREFVKPNDPILIKTAEPIKESEITSLATQSLIEEMLQVAYGEQTDRQKPLLVGLAAPQIGISKKIILVDVAADGKGNIGNLRVFINPEITYKSADEQEWYEGCYSTDRVCGIVERPSQIRVKAFDQNGNLVEGNYEDYTARIFQHEIDHLDGKEFVAHISNDQKLHWVEEDEFSEYRNNEAWRTWKKLCPREKWEKIKNV